MSKIPTHLTVELAVTDLTSKVKYGADPIWKASGVTLQSSCPGGLFLIIFSYTAATVGAPPAVDYTTRS